ncbi:39S ribosomal protein L22, mitochondrial [Coemansia guatemalensis]|uniref:39S ribosomal protein L22, mitochondrial n=1 Tax=Coemansia guatemalensis TaxID=2761395 RepID=A0A9W8HT70_9FUNG|nr:39S ribosomal protein L22, mitochondrial [Coemansia guatemalensis]
MLGLTQAFVNLRVGRAALARGLQTSTQRLESKSIGQGADKSASSVFASITNEEPPADDTAAKLTHTDYKTLVGKYGHGITKIRETQFSMGNFPVSPRKLGMLARQITGQPLNEAIRQMEFSSKRAAKRIRSSLVNARRNAIVHRKMNPENMIVKLARVGKGTFRKKMDMKARGRFGIIRNPTAHLKYVLWEKPEGIKPTGRDAIERALLAGDLQRRKGKGFKLSRKVWMPLDERKPVINAKPYYNW